MEQTFCAGIGNWMADEIFYQSKIHPATRVENLSDEQIDKLHKWTHHITKQATDIDEHSWHLPQEWLFHFRWSKRTKTPKDYFGNSIKFDTIAGRTTAIVPAILTGKSSESNPKRKRSTSQTQNSETVSNSETSQKTKSQRTRIKKSDVPAGESKRSARSARTLRPR